MSIRSLLKFKLHSANSANSRCHPRQKTCRIKLLDYCLLTFQQVQNRENCKCLTLLPHKQDSHAGMVEGEPQTNNNRAELFIFKSSEAIYKKWTLQQTFLQSRWSLNRNTQSSPMTQPQAFLASSETDYSLQPRATRFLIPCTPEMKKIFLSDTKVDYALWKNLPEFEFLKLSPKLS